MVGVRAIRFQEHQQRECAQLYEEMLKFACATTLQQAEAMYWKDWFWTVRVWHVSYAGEPAHV